MSRGLVGLVLVGVLFAAACGRPASEPASSPPPVQAESQLARGQYLVAVLGCDDCHSPKVMGTAGPEPDKSRRLSGHPAASGLPPPPKLDAGPWGVVATLDLTAWSGPWGISYAINLTPDEDTGIGIWTKEMFIKMIRTGKHMGQSRPVLPPMPTLTYSHLSDDDLRAVFAFLKALPPITNRVPEPVIAAP